MISPDALHILLAPLIDLKVKRSSFLSFILELSLSLIFSPINLFTFEKSIVKIFFLSLELSARCYNSSNYEESASYLSIWWWPFSSLKSTFIIPVFDFISEFPTQQKFLMPFIENENLLRRLGFLLDLSFWKSPRSWGWYPTLKFDINSSLCDFDLENSKLSYSLFIFWILPPLIIIKLLIMLLWIQLPKYRFFM